VSLSNDRPENAQLLRQDGATWLRQDRVGEVPVDVMTGPVRDGRAESSFRYWVDADGRLLRLEARLDGQHWSTFNFNDLPDTELDLPEVLESVLAGDDASAPIATTG